MFRRNKKTRKYQTPGAQVTHMALENNFCATVRFKLQMEVNELDNVNADEAAAPAEYFEDIIS